MFNNKEGNPLFNSKAHPILGQNLEVMEGDDWRRVRTVLSPTFSASRMRKMFVQMRECVDSMVTELNTRVTTTSQPYTEVDIIDLFDRLSADIVTTCLYSFKLNPWADSSDNLFVVNATHTFTPSRLRLLLYTLLPKYMLTALGVKHPVRDSANEYIISMTRHIIAERKRNTSNNYNDFIDLAINAEKNNTEGDSQGTRDHHISGSNCEMFLKTL